MFCKNCGTEFNKNVNLCDKCKEKTLKKQRVAIAMLIVSFLFLYFSIPPSDVPGYFVGNLIRVIVIWAILIGCVAYLIWRFVFKKRQGLFLFIFAVIFFLAAIFEFGVNVFRGYVVSDIDTSEFRETLEKSIQESNAMRNELNKKGLMSKLERQEGKPFEEMPDNVIKDFLNKNINN